MAASEQERRQAELAELNALQKERENLKELINEKTWHYNKFAQSGEQKGYAQKRWENAGQWAYEKLTGKEKEPYKRDPYTNPYGLKDGPRNAYNEIGQDRYNEKGTAELKQQMEAACVRIDAIDKYLQNEYQITQDPRACYDTIPDQLGKAIEERERLVERSVSTMAERRAAKLAAQVEAQQQAPASQPLQAGQQVTRETQATHNEEFYRQLDEKYTKKVEGDVEAKLHTSPPETMPTSQHQAQATKVPFKDLFKDDTLQRQEPSLQAPEMGEAERRVDQKASKADTPREQPPPTEAPQTSQHQKIPLIDRYKDETPEEEHQPAQEHEPTDTQEDTHAGWEALKLAAQLQEMEQEVKQLDNGMTLEQQERSGPWKTPLRDLYDLGPETGPQQEPGPDRSR